ncbi:MAG: CHAT domain-containing protein [Candidatus Zixiibacteriota bacterium]|nr:MAG: CHAT domain-containing protein [candidate division Zixibacteria bacterium]
MADSAEALYQQALHLAETESPLSDTTVQGGYYDVGLPHRANFPSYEKAQQVYSHVLSAAESIFGATAAETAEILAKLAKAYYMDEKYSEAEPLAKKALTLNRDRFGDRSLKVAGTLLLQGKINYFWGKTEKSESLFVEALSIAEQTGGLNHPLVAQCRYSLANQWRWQGDCAAADSLLSSARTIFESAYSNYALERSRFLLMAGRVKYCLGDYEGARENFGAAVAHRTNSLGRKTEKVASTLCYLGDALSKLGQHAQAESTYTEALSIRRELWGENDIRVAYSLGYLGWFHRWFSGNILLAESLYTQATTIIEQGAGIDNSDYIYYAWRLEDLLKDQGRFGEALPICEKRYTASAAVYGSEDIRTIRALSQLGSISRRLGRFADAEAYQKQALAAMEKLRGPEHYDVTEILMGLALTYDTQYRSEEAEKLYQRALEIYRKVLDPSDPDIAYTLHDLALVYWSTDEFDRAESHILQALEIWRNAPEPEEYGIAIGLSNLGLTYESQGRYAEADSVLRMAIDLGEKVLGPQHPGLAHACDNLANVLTKQGRYAEAEPVIERAVGILERSLGPEHPEVAKFCRDQGRLYAYAGNSEMCLQTYRTFIDWSQRFLENVFPYSSENQRLRWIHEYPLLDHALLSLALREKTDASNRLALEMVCKSKAMVVEAVMSERQAALCTYDDALAEQLNQLNKIHSQIATIALAGGSLTDSLQALYETKDSMEIALSRECSEFGDALAARRFDLDDVLSAIPAGSALWEFVRYEPHNLDPSVTGRAKLGPMRYLAFAADRSGSISVIDLGNAQLIDSLITLARGIMYKAQGQIYSPAARTSEQRLNQATSELYRILFAPLATVSNEAEHICIAPDGMINLLPLEILPTPDGSYVIEDYRISYLSSGRDLLKYRDSPRSDGEMLVMADPDFNSSSFGPMTQGNPQVPVASLGVETYGPELRGVTDCLNTAFGRLRHSRSEAEAVVRQFRASGDTPTREFYDDEAVESVLKSIYEPPGVLHLATHGFFCESDEATPTMRNNPLLRSGLVLAGANVTLSGKRDDSTTAEDGILTALEVSGLNLVGTDLAVLSACESGVGDFVNGEGIFGLRRAFQHAGVETIVMSLWAVPDRETSQLMEGFYRRWLGGSSKRDALRESAIAVLNESRQKRGCGHPLLWGGFILTGNPN